VWRGSAAPESEHAFAPRRDPEECCVALTDHMGERQPQTVAIERNRAIEIRNGQVDFEQAEDVVHIELYPREALVIPAAARSRARVPCWR